MTAIDDFPAATLAAWRASVGEAAADGVPVTALEDGLTAAWLYTRSDAPRTPAGLGGRAPGTAWEIRQEHSGVTCAATREAILEDLEGGVDAIGLRLGGDRRAGTPATTVDALDETLRGVRLDRTRVALDAGPSGVEAAALLVALLRRRGHGDEALGALRVDPLGALAREGRLPQPPTDAVERAARLAADADRRLGPGVTILAADTRAYANAGATPADELALLAATVATYLRAGERAGLPPARATARLELTLTVDADQFLGIAKLRAARRILTRMLELSGVPAAERGLRLYARTAERMLSTVDPSVNLLRMTTAAFAAAVGGADGITVMPFDQRQGASRHARRIARNTQFVLLEEAQLARVADPGAGAWYVERLTEDLARAAWTRLHELERAGGLVAALQTGLVEEWIAAAAARRAAAIDRRERLLVGVSAFPLLGADEVPHAAPAPLALASEPGPATAPATAGFDELVARAEAGESLSELAAGAVPYAASALTPAYDSLRFETLRAARAGSKGVLLVCVGPRARHAAAAAWARDVFESGGLPAHATAPLTDPEAARDALLMLRIAVLCAAPDEDPALLRAITLALREAGAWRVYVALGDAERADADFSLRDGIPMLSVLEEVPV